MIQVDKKISSDSANDSNPSKYMDDLMMPIVMVMITMMMMMVMTMVRTCDHSLHLNTQWVETKFSLFAFHLVPKSFREIKTLYFYKILEGTWEC